LQALTVGTLCDALVIVMLATVKSASPSTAPLSLVIRRFMVVVSPVSAQRSVKSQPSGKGRCCKRRRGDTAADDQIHGGLFVHDGAP